MTLSELRTLVCELWVSWARRESRRPDRFAGIDSYLAAVAGGLLDSKPISADQVERVSRMDEGQLLANLAELRKQLTAAMFETVDCPGWKPDGKHHRGKALLVVSSVDDENFDEE